MTVEYQVDVSQLDPKVRRYLDELRARIQERYPDADFIVYEGEDPKGIYLAAITDAESLSDVSDLVIDRVVDIQLDEGIALYVEPVHRTPPAWMPPRPLEEVLQEDSAGGAVLTQP